MDKILNQLQDKVYELEGLVLLALSREDKHDALSPLIISKIKEIDSVGKLLNADSRQIGRSEEMEIPEDAESPDVYDESSEVYEESREDDDNPEIYEENPDVYNEEPEQPKKSRRPPVFCINDRFRFRRELFNGSDEAFNGMLDKVSVMYDYEDAEAYFIGIKGLDPEDETVADFLDILKAYYEANRHN